MYISPQFPKQSVPVWLLPQLVGWLVPLVGRYKHVGGLPASHVRWMFHGKRNGEMYNVSMIICHSKNSQLSIVNDKFFFNK